MKKGIGSTRVSAPTARDVALGRANADMSSDAAAAIVGLSGRQWRYYEEGKGSMNPELWLLFCIRTGQIKPDVK